MYSRCTRSASFGSSLRESNWRIDWMKSPLPIARRIASQSSFSPLNSSRTPSIASWTGSGGFPRWRSSSRCAFLMPLTPRRAASSIGSTSFRSAPAAACCAAISPRCSASRAEIASASACCACACCCCPTIAPSRSSACAFLRVSSWSCCCSIACSSATRARLPAATEPAPLTRRARAREHGRAMQSVRTPRAAARASQERGQSARVRTPSQRHVCSIRPRPRSRCFASSQSSFRFAAWSATHCEMQSRKWREVR